MELHLEEIEKAKPERAANALEKPEAINPYVFTTKGALNTDVEIVHKKHAEGKAAIEEHYDELITENEKGNDMHTPEDGIATGPLGAPSHNIFELLTHR